MAGLVIVTDSTSDLPKELIEQYGIVVVPLKVLFGSETLRDGVDITSQEFFQRMASTEVVPTTSQPSPGDFTEVYEKLLQEGSDILSIHISSDLSGTIHSARLAKSLLEDETRIEIIDSRVVSMGLGLIVLEAAKAIKAGKSKQEVIALVQTLIERIRIYFLVDTLEYLARGGRIGKANALLGTLLNIKPVLTFKDGITYPFDKVRGFNKAIQRIADSLSEEFGNSEVSVAFVHGIDMELYSSFEKKITEQLNCKEVLTTWLSPVVGAHGGPGVVGVICLP